MSEKWKGPKHETSDQKDPRQPTTDHFLGVRGPWGGVGEGGTILPRMVAGVLTRRWPKGQANSI